MKDRLPSAPGLFQAAPIEKRVLVVDDELEFREMLVEYLQRRGFDTLEAANGHEALFHVQEFRPPVVLLDVWMPGLNGVETLRRIKALPQKTHVVMVSANEDEEQARQTLTMGASDYVFKPVDYRYLDSVLLTLMARGIAELPKPSEEVNGEAPKLSQLPWSLEQPGPPGADPTRWLGGAVEADLDAAREAFHRALAIVEEIFESVRAYAPFSIDKVAGAVAILLQNLEISDALLAPFIGTDGGSMSPAQEVVNVCILSEKIGIELDYPPDELHELGLAAFLHGVGMARLPKELDERTGPLSRAGRVALNRCPEEGAEIVRGLGARYAQVADVVLQVRERMDGSGYPRGLRGEEIHPHAQVVGVADLYESLVRHRPFRERFWPPQALAAILPRERASFPDRILKALIRVVATVPLGSLVRLNSGEVGRVVAKNQDLPLRPVVAMLVRRGRRLPEPDVMDLSQDAVLQVQEFVAEELLDGEV
ncbi:MAG: response regulator [Candidatus Methylomirabilia bacterium]